jgi:hypothetical protein
VVSLATISLAAGGGIPVYASSSTLVSRLVLQYLLQLHSLSRILCEVFVGLFLVRHCWFFAYLFWHCATTTFCTVRYVPVVSGFWSFLSYDFCVFYSFCSSFSRFSCSCYHG